jgi:hypothetical protein
MDSALRILGEIVAYGGGSAAIAYLLFQWLGKTWIEDKFSQRLEQLRHEQALEIQKLRVEVESLLSGAIKLQEREFEVLPKAWEKLDEAHSKVSWLVAPYQTYADVNRMTDDELEEFLESTAFSEYQKKEIMVSRDRAETYRHLVFIYRAQEVKSTFGDLQAYVARNGIFMDEELKEKMATIADSLWTAIVSKETGHEVKDWEMQRESWDKVKEETEPLYKEIELHIQSRYVHMENLINDLI